MKPKHYKDLGFACIDTGRQKRRGFPEVIFCQNKTEKDIVRIARELGKDTDAPLLLTKLDKELYLRIRTRIAGLKYNDRARVAFRKPRSSKTSSRQVLIITGGTSDIPVAEEAAVTLDLMGAPVEKLYDVGVAGVHRILDKKSALKK
ncbi:MAG TPA: 1-(5-phosphoribosyl)-5-amino-4-imidazole-carboxylate carboxylase, partial [Candidatus Omnitrophota bacterium]|nr:1-(5-phosphoribosyl)-5-amino-4-imidazole-carboxylate carboxylase [Candidatus Omnitrophota bacterium]